MFIESVDTRNILCKKAIIRLQDHLLELGSLCRQNSSKLLIVSMPNRPYGFASTITALKKLGFTTERVDSIDANLPTRTAVSEIPFQVIYPQMKGNSLFYEIDGHWNAKGNLIFAKQLIIKLDSLPQWKHLLTSSSF
jgi:hypothetical protein